MVRLAVTVLVNTLFQNVQDNMAARPAEKTWAYFSAIANCLQLILNQYQEVGQRPAHTACRKQSSPGGHFQMKSAIFYFPSKSYTKSAIFYFPSKSYTKSAIFCFPSKSYTKSAIFCFPSKSYTKSAIFYFPSKSYTKSAIFYFPSKS